MSVVVAQRASGAGQNQAQAIALLEELGIAHLAMNYLDSLSGGQKQLVGLAQSLIRLHSRLFAAPHYYCWMNH